MKKFFRLQISTLSYLAWSGLYLVFEFLRHQGWTVDLCLFDTLHADFAINMVSPFLLVACGFFVAYLPASWKPRELFVSLLIGLFCGSLILLFMSLLWNMGGVSLLLGAVLFLSRVNWLRFVAGNDLGGIYLFARGLVGPFLFFAPALLIVSLVFGRENFGYENLDFVPLFGTIYFFLQAIFEELMLRLKGHARKDGSITWAEEKQSRIE